MTRREVTKGAQVPVSIAVSPPRVQLAIGEEQQFVAAKLLTPSGNLVDISASVTWASDDPDILSIDPDTGLATAVSVGVVSVSAHLGALVGIAVVQVTSSGGLNNWYYPFAIR